MSVGNVKSWWRISVSGRGRVGDWLLVVARVLDRPVVRVAHVHRSDYRRRWRVLLQPLVSQQARWVLSVCHCLRDFFVAIGMIGNGCNLYGEIWLKLAKVWSSLVHYGVEVVFRIVVISHKTAISLSK